MNLSEYISITRTVSDTDTELSEFIYKKCYERILSAFGNCALLPELKVVYTLQRSTEIMVLSGKEYLLYDQYLGQTMNMLNRILLNSDTPMDAEMYSFKLLAERYALGGQFQMATIFAYSYLTMKQKYNSYMQEKDFIRRSRFTFYQELFIIAHEIAHLIIKKPARYLPIAQKNSFIAPESKNNNVDYSTIIRSLAERFKLGQIDYDIFAPSGFIGQWLDVPDFNTSSDIREECCCDVLAIIMLISILRQDKNVDFSDVLIATAMCLRHIRLLGIVDLIYSEIWFKEQEEQSEKSTLTHDLILRTSNIREFITALRRIDIEGVNRLQGYEIVQMAEHYEEILDDPVMFSVPEKLGELMSVLKMSKHSANNSMFTLREIGELTGFFETAS